MTNDNVHAPVYVVHTRVSNTKSNTPSNTLIEAKIGSKVKGLKLNLKYIKNEKGKECAYEKKIYI